MNGRAASWTGWEAAAPQPRLLVDTKVHTASSVASSRKVRSLYEVKIKAAQSLTISNFFFFFNLDLRVNRTFLWAEPVL